MDLRVTTPAQAKEFVDDVGFCLLFPSEIEMPSLWDAIAGRVVKTYSSHSGYEIERTWGWKDDSRNKKRWYYGKLLRHKATLDRRAASRDLRRANVLIAEPTRARLAAHDAFVFGHLPPE